MISLHFRSLTHRYVRDVVNSEGGATEDVNSDGEPVCVHACVYACATLREVWETEITDCARFVVSSNTK